MDFLILAICLALIAIGLAVGIYVVMIKVFQTDSLQVFTLALLALVIAELMIIFLLVLCVFKLTGIA